MRARGTRLVALLVGLGFGVTEASAVRPADEAIFPAADYTSAEGRALAEAHGPQLEALYDDVRRCAPELDFQLDGIAFQRSKRVPAGDHHLTLWVWLDPGRPPLGRDTAARATAAFRQYGQRLARRLVGRAPVAADSRVGGYGLILTWLGPRKIKDTPVAESLVVFSRKDEVIAFAGGQTEAPTFLAASEVRAFDGQTEVPFPPLTVPEVPGPAGLDGC